MEEPVSAGPRAAVAQCEYLGVYAGVRIKDDPDHPDYVLIELVISPAPPGLDRLAYSRHQRIPPA